MGREVLDKHLETEPTHKTMVDWDWRVELLGPRRRKIMFKVFTKEDPWRWQQVQIQQWLSKLRSREVP